jgi:formylglycine-generating enzyme required for sulfatase activity
MKTNMHLMILVAVLLAMYSCAITGTVTAEDKQAFTSPTFGAKFVLIPAVTFMMGSLSNKPGRFNNETFHQVTISKPYYMQTTEVTQGQWNKVMGNRPSYFKDCGEDCPVEQVSWYDVQEFIKKLNLTEGENKYRLPTEAEWEYAARGGEKNEEYSGGNDVNAVAWYNSNSGDKTHPVAQKLPNKWRLFDMSGNVYEWCSDWYGLYPSKPASNPKGPPTGDNRVYRGGGWHYGAWSCRVAYRDGIVSDRSRNDLGFRLVFSVQ